MYYGYTFYQYRSSDADAHACEYSGLGTGKSHQQIHR